MTHTNRTDGGFTITGRHVLIGFCVFFGLIFASNAVMIYLALSTFPGLESKSAYKAGRDYNQQIETARAQADLGWSGMVEFRQETSTQTQLLATFADREGRPLNGLKVQGVMRRTVHENQDVPVLLESLGHGTYSVKLDRTRVQGQWLLRLTAEDGLGGTFRLDQKVYLKP